MSTENITPQKNNTEQQPVTNCLKTFVWENVLGDYTSGLVTVVAHNEKEAWELLFAESPTIWHQLQGEPRVEELFNVSMPYEEYAKAAHKLTPETGYFESATRPEEVTEPKVFYVSGGG